MSTLKSEENCPICGGVSRLESGFDDIRLFRCAHCDHCFTDLKALKKLEDYDSSYFHDTHKNWNDHPFTWLFERVGGLVVRWKKDAALLDLGCGTGDLLKHLHKKYPAMPLTGIDLSPAQHSNGVKIHRGDFLTYDLKEQFDVVVSIQAIEHVTDVQKFVKRVYELTRPGGMIIISTINDRSISYGVARLFNQLGYKAAYERLYSRHHLHHFNIKSLKKLMEKNGFAVEKILRHNEPLLAVDMPQKSVIVRNFLRLGVLGTFVLGKLTGKTVLQTIVCRKKS